MVKTTKIKNKPFLNLAYDKVFRSIILNSDKTYLNNLLSQILEEKVEVKTFLNNNLKPLSLKDKDKNTDLIVELKDNRIIHLELNRKISKGLKERNLVYYASLYGTSLEVSQRYEELKNITHISIDVKSNKWLPIKEEYYLTNEKTNKKYSENFKMIIVNIASCKREWYDKNILGEEENIYITAIGANKKELKELGKVNKIMKEVSEEVFILNEDGTYSFWNWTPEEKEKVARDLDIQFARQDAEKKSIRNMAKRMLKMNMSIDKIAEITKLSPKQIKNLKYHLPK